MWILNSAFLLENIFSYFSSVLWNVSLKPRIYFIKTISGTEFVIFIVLSSPSKYFKYKLIVFYFFFSMQVNTLQLVYSRYVTRKCVSDFSNAVSFFGENLNFTKLLPNFQPFILLFLFICQVFQIRVKFH